MMRSIDVSRRTANSLTAAMLAFATSATFSDRRMIDGDCIVDDTGENIRDMAVIRSAAAMLPFAAAFIEIHGHDGHSITIALR